MKSGSGKLPGEWWIRVALRFFPRELRATYGEDLVAAWLDLREEVRRTRSRRAAPWVLALKTLVTGLQVARAGVSERWSEALRSSRPGARAG